MRRQPLSIGLVVMGGLVVVLGGLLWYLLRRWPYAPVFAVLVLLGLGVVLVGFVGDREWRRRANHLLAQLACLLVLATVLFPVLWIVGMSMDPRDILRPLDMSPVTNIAANLLRVAPKRFPLPDDSAVFRMPAAGERGPTTVEVLQTSYQLPEGYTKADLQRPEVWRISRDLIEWAPLVPLPQGSETVVFPGQVTLLPEDVQVAALVPLEDAVRPDGWIVLNGRSYAVPRGWSLRRADRPTLWLLHNNVVHWGILSLLPEEGLMSELAEGQEPACSVVLDEREGQQRYTCPQGYVAETASEPSYWLAGEHMALCNGRQSSDISEENLNDVAHYPAIWRMGRAIVDWRASSLKAFAAVIRQPTTNPVGFTRMLLNSTLLALGVSFFAVLVGTTAAYAFSRFRFPGRQVGMLGFVLVLMMPSVATLAPLFAILNAVEVKMTAFQIAMLVLGSAAGLVGIGLILRSVIQRADGWRWLILPLVLIALGAVLDLNALGALSRGAEEPFILRDSLWGVGIAMLAGALPFSIWNMKGFVDTIPLELEESARIDGASPSQTFFRIMLPLAVPGLAVTALFGFMSGWTEFVLSWQFLTQPKDFTLSMALYGMQGRYAAETPWANFAAMSILVAIPVTAVFFALQKYVVGGLTAGAVKG